MNSIARDSPAPPGVGFDDLIVGTEFGPVSFTVSRAANDRYWDAAGIEHPARAAGVLYPPIAANLTIVALQTVAPGPLLHTHQRLVSHRAVEAPAELSVTGSVTARTTRRDRDYLEVTAVVSQDGEPLWTSVATFVEAGA
jgi:hypothetical protein